MSSEEGFERSTVPRVKRHEVDAILEQHDHSRERTASLIEKSKKSVERTSELVWASIGRLILSWNDEDSDGAPSEEPKAG